MPAVTLRLVLSLAAASTVAVLAACSGSTNDGTTTDDGNALTAADEARFDRLLLDAFASSTETNFRTTDDGERSCYAGSPTTKVYGWDALGGQWFAPSLRANLRTRQLADELTVIQVPTGQANVVDVIFLGTPTDLDGAVPSLCAARSADADAAADAGIGLSPAPTGNLRVLLTCKGVTMTDVTTTIPAALCGH